MKIRVLGPIDVVGDDGGNLAIGGPIPTRLLALLVVVEGDGMAVDDLVEHLWAGVETPADPPASLRTYVARLRAVLGADSIRTRTGRYSLNSDVAVDARHFEELVDRARRFSGSPGAIGIWAEAVSVWRGRAFGDHADVEVIRPAAAHLEELRAEALEGWFDARLAAGEGRELVADVEAAATEFPLREGFRAQQLTTLARAGRQAEALRAFQEFRGALTEVGLEPSARLVELDATIAAGATPTTGARRTLRGYEIGDRIGDGAFAVVFRATQSSVGREVAIKQIRRELADEPNFIRQFEAEAHLVARLEHPHVVPLHDYWREPGSAYLVMRYLDGGSLLDGLRHGYVDLELVVAQISQVAAALDEAHNSGVVHRDVKPANILLDTTGNAYLSDFGIAVEEAERLDPESWLSHGSPSYAAPEQLRREAVGPAADVYALGVTVYEALSGHLPFRTETTMAGLLERQLNEPLPLVRSTRPEIPAAVDTVIQRATAKDPADRYPSAGRFAADLTRAAGMEGDGELFEAEPRNPYKGLAAFDEADAADFTGRSRLVASLVHAVQRSSVVAVVGPSGSGKSSVVRAGLLPAIRQGRIPGSGRWFVSDLSPGPDPFSELERALLRVAVDAPPDLAAELRAGRGALARLIDRVIPDGRDLLLVIDQFEELFTLVDATVRRQFLAGIVEATRSTDRLRLVVTIRADFYDQPLQHPELAAAIEESTVVVRPLAPDELERAITEPATAVGARFENGLVARITADVADQPGSLPLLQFTLTRLYEARIDEQLTTAAYTDMGGVAGALAQHAESLWEELPPGEQTALRHVMGRLVSLGEGSEDTRRRALRSEIATSAAAERAVDTFGAARLLTFDRDPTTRSQTVEVAHEALLRAWPRLRGWIDDDREELRDHRHLTTAATIWDQRGRPESELYRGGRLESVEDWLDDRGDQLTDLERQFLGASVDQREREQAHERRQLTRLRRRLAAVAVIAAIALVAGVVAVVQRGRANDEADRANEQTELAEDRLTEANQSSAEARIAALVSGSAVEAPVDVDVGLNLALLAYADDPSVETTGALLNSLSFVPGLIATHRGGASSVNGHIGCGTTDFDGRFVLGRPTADGSGHEVVFVDPRTGAFETLAAPPGLHCIQLPSPDGAYLAGPREPGFDSLVISDAATGSVVEEFAACHDLGWTRDGRFLLALSLGDGECGLGPVDLVTFDPTTGATQTIETELAAVDGGPTYGQRFADLGVAGLTDSPAELTNIRWDLETLEQTHAIPLGDAFPTAFHESADGTTLYAPTIDGPTVLFDAATGERIAEIAVPKSASPFIYSVRLSPDGLLLAAATETGTLRVIDTATGEEVMPAIEDSDGIVNLIWIDETSVAVQRNDGSVDVFDVALRGIVEELILCCEQRTDGSVARQQFGLKFDAERRVVISYASALEGVRQRIDFQPLDGSDPDRVALGDDPEAYDPEGELFFAEVNSAGEAVVFDSTLGGYFLSPDGSRRAIDPPPGVLRPTFVSSMADQAAVGVLVLAEDESTEDLALIDLLTGDIRLLGLEPLGPSSPSAATPHPDADVAIVVGTADGAVVQLGADGTASDPVRAFAAEPVVRMAVHPSGSQVLAVAPSGDVAVVDLSAGEVVATLQPGRPVTGITFGLDEATAVIVDDAGRVALWDLDRGREVGELFDNESAGWGSPAVDPDRRVVWVGLGDYLYALPLDPGRWRELACERRSRELTPEEWQELVPGDNETREVCP